jgi:predicted metal-dependent HD superfamily phosphohydrolase
VAALIEMTADHGSHTAVSGDAALFLDCDMAIVGAPPAPFDTYNAAIAAEYSHVPRDAFAAGRRAFLQSLADRPRIFLTSYFHDRLDAQARANVRRVLTGT